MLSNIPEQPLSKEIIGAAIEVHKVIGPGLKEEVYEAALEVELKLRGINSRRQVPVRCTYKGVCIDDRGHPKVSDMLVEDQIVVECKAVNTPKDPLFKAQCLTYLKMTGKRLGLVLNFGRPTLAEGIDRVINETKEEYRMRLAQEDEDALRRVLREEDGVPDAEMARVCQEYRMNQLSQPPIRDFKGLPL